MPPSKLKFIDEAQIDGKTILLRADFDVSLHPDFSIANDYRITHNLPTIEYLLKHKNKLICVAKLGRPKGRDKEHSLKVVAKRLQEYLKNYKVKLVEDFTKDDTLIKNQKEDEILILENIRFYPEEKNNDKAFAKKLASLADVYVNDAFSMCHRVEASIVGVPAFIPGFGGLLLKKEIEMISKAIHNPKKPVVSIMGGAKISTKIPILKKLTELSDYILVGGALANVFLLAEGFKIGKSLYEKDQVEAVKKLLSFAKRKRTKIMIPTDAICKENGPQSRKVTNLNVESINGTCYIMDIGEETRAEYGWIIDKAKTIIWNGPMGYIEDTVAREGTDFIYYCITSNKNSVSIVGGGDTLAAISKKEYINKITHVSTGGGAMIEYIEKGTLPGFEALKHTVKL